MSDTQFMEYNGDALFGDCVPVTYLVSYDPAAI